MKKGALKKGLSMMIAASMAVTMAACGSKKDESSSKGDGSADVADVTIDQIKLGEDYTDIKADLKFLTHKTDIIDTDLKGYVEDFQKMYPNVNIEYEGITDYNNDITTRLSTGDWGDICMVPTTVDKDEFENYFVSFGDKEDLAKIYEADMLNDKTYANKVYGLPSMANAFGIVYNKAVFEKAGVGELPKTPDEFLDALKKIKDNTDAIPMYTNFAAGWTMTAWDAYIDGTATGDADWVNTGLTKGENPFSDRGDGTGPYAVYKILYEAVKNGYTEDDPTTTDWEGSKSMLNEGKIGCMALGSWVVSQAQGAGEHGDDVAYMAFPITAGGKQNVGAGPDFCYGINCNSSSDEKIAAMCYVKYLVEKSGFAQKQGGLSIVIGDEYPEALSALEGMDIIVNKPAASGEENLYNDINNDSELGINVSGAVPTQIVEEAVSGTRTFEEMVDEWNEKWTAAQESNGVTH